MISPYQQISLHLYLQCVFAPTSAFECSSRFFSQGWSKHVSLQTPFPKTLGASQTVPLERPYMSHNINNNNYFFAYQDSTSSTSQLWDISNEGSCGCGCYKFLHDRAVPFPSIAVRIPDFCQANCWRHSCISLLLPASLNHAGRRIFSPMTRWCSLVACSCYWGPYPCFFISSYKSWKGLRRIGPFLEGTHYVGSATESVARKRKHWSLYTLNIFFAFSVVLLACCWFERGHRSLLKGLDTSPSRLNKNLAFMTSSCLF